MAEVFSDDLNLEICDLPSRSFSPRHPPTLRAPVHSYAIDPSAHLHVCARARSSLRARYTFAPVVASDLLSRPLYPATRSFCARPLMLMRPNQAHKRMRDLYTRAPVVACARSRSRLRPAHARTRCSLRAANACAPVPPVHPVPTLWVSWESWWVTRRSCAGR
jgi:hypothetical protein